MEPVQTLRESNSGFEIIWQGYLTVPFVKEWKNLSDVWTNTKGKIIHLDLQGIERIDSAGIQFLVYLKELSQTKHYSIHLKNHSLAVLKVLDLLGLVSFFGDRVKVKKEHSNEVEFRYGTRKTS
ncbi:STAS domain-containing protein [Leptospira kanakyensis]|uniref:Anti-sigma factor antagonist n=1 Tax=Leptospira kanakyensis TaxID=2484968 RepID=A0A6N4QJ64_9LEPT|nr:STAS domain-containing protein [Leptospira kanakyensis]MCW7481683.1 STAS domain-containing protein [Leptospira kanakyensis]TGK53783.1 anti-sigma factor antagonist [Leptospira kanakyensis]TGK57578.1 anti-sigma factor antagonist [Leptospira kanakyensis]TGK73288.1 anti-sigma factor antagonist [Leptospira kanakyensis]